MTLDELYHLSREESIERIKGEARSQAKRRLWGGAIAFLFIVGVIINILVKEQDPLRIVFACQFAVFAIAAGWSAVNNFRLLQRMDSLNAPEHLLYWYEKAMKHNRNAYYLGMLGLICNLGDRYAFINHEWNWIFVELTIMAALLVFVTYSYFKGDYLKYKTDRDEEIIDRLQDLIDMK